MDFDRLRGGTGELRWGKVLSVSCGVIARQAWSGSVEGRKGLRLSRRSDCRYGKGTDTVGQVTDVSLKKKTAEEAEEAEEADLAAQGMRNVDCLQSNLILSSQPAGLQSVKSTRRVR